MERGVHIVSVALAEVISMPIQSISDDIKTFIRSQESINTQKSYERSLRYFFKYTRNKDIEDLTIKDLIFRNVDILKYKNHLTEKYDSASSVNTYLSSLFSLYKQLEKDYKEIEYKTIRVDLLKNDAEPHGKITKEEAELMCLHAKDEEWCGYEKYCLVKLAYLTQIRKSALLKIKFSDITVHPEDNKFYKIHGIDKGKKRFEKPISKDFYEELLAIKNTDNYKEHNDGYLFHLGNTTIWDMINRIKDKMGISPERNVTFHSLRSVGAIYAVRVLGDIKRAQKELGHSNISLTMSRYVDDDKDFLNSPSLLMEKEINNDIFKELSRKELLELVLSQSAGTLAMMKEQANRIILSRS